MLKVAKFGGSSMADAKQFEKVRDIVRADPARKVIVVSAAGKRSADDHKLTDLLYLCYAHLQYGVNCDAVFQMICDRYIAIRDECGLNVDIEAELDVLRRQMRAGISEEELVSRGEYFSALLMADSATRFWTRSCGCAFSLTARSTRRRPTPRSGGWPTGAALSSPAFTA